MKVNRKFTTAGQDPFESVTWTTRSSRITNPDGSVVFEMPDAEVPESWSQLATDIMVSKYFRKAGVPQMTDRYAIIAEGWETAAKKAKKGSTPKGVVVNSDGEVATGPERSARQVIHRLAGCWRYWGEQNKYFDSAEDAQAFYDELVYMLVHQMCAPNSPQWFNTGLNWAYGIDGPAQGHWVADHETGELALAETAYRHPQPHACFIQSITDDLVNEGGIMDLWTREARLFKYGSGTGTNFSQLRAEGEPLSGGGKSSGLMSWLKIGDRAAAAIKSGGTTRRAAKMVCLDMDHPDIGSFINWKVREEIKVAALVEGMKKIAGEKASDLDTETIGETAGRLGLQLDYDFNGEAYTTVSGQNSNNSVRIPDSFFDAVDEGGTWETTYRTTGETATVYEAKRLWEDIAYAAWRCADPGVQYDTTINAWHTCPSGGRINASNPCSEYMFVDNTACNLASFNVLKFYDRDARSFDVEAYEHGIDIWTMVLEISVMMAAFPSREIAELSWKYRTLGLGYANLGAMLMQAGIPYDSEEGRAIGACLTAILTGRSYRKSAQLAGEHGAFAGYADDQENMLRVIRNHRLAAHGVERESEQYEKLRIRPVPIDHRLIESGGVPMANAVKLLQHAKKAWDEAYQLGSRHGYRNAQVTVIAPTGTIGLLMDCDTTGVEPDFALVKFKKLAGGGYFKIANNSLKPSLEALGYSDAQVAEILRYILGTLDLDVPMPYDDHTEKLGVQPGMTFAQWLRSKGATDEDLGTITDQLPGVFELKFAFGSWALGDEALTRLGLDPAEAKADFSFNALKALGLKNAHLADLNEMICGTQTIEGAPHVEDEHLPVFDCANTCGTIGKRFIAPQGHIRMMAAAQPFISGAISKTINLPHDAKVEDIKDCYRLSWELGLKANALYRDGCKLSQPLNIKSDEDLEDTIADEVTEDPTELAEARSEIATRTAGLAAAVAAGDAKTTADIERDIKTRPMRRRLPDTRRSLTHKFNVAGHEGYLTVGLYEDGMPGELFITMAKEGSTIGGLMDSLGTATSVSLQYGVPLQSMVKKFTHQRFEPAGMTTNSDIPFAKSLVDYIFRWLGIQFIPGYREKVVPQYANKTANAPTAAAAKPATSDRSVTPSGGDTRWKNDTTPSHDAKTTDAEEDRPETIVRKTVSAESIVTETKPHINPTTGDIDGAVTATSVLSVALESAGDAPPCDVCGTITVRSGTCYKCLNCGNSMGCS
ncbi:MAG: adenosylcobalamin-dependent ribonucleoside-diphosphate reductase [Planctomycetota bacterium]